MFRRQRGACPCSASLAMSSPSCSECTCCGSTGTRSYRIATEIGNEWSCVVRAMVLSNPGKIEMSPLSLRELPVPQPGPGEIRVRVQACALCRTDLHVIEAELPPQRAQIVPG